MTELRDKIDQYFENKFDCYAATNNDEVILAMTKKSAVNFAIQSQINSLEKVKNDLFQASSNLEIKTVKNANLQGQITGIDFCITKIGMKIHELKSQLL